MAHVMGPEIRLINQSEDISTRSLPARGGQARVIAGRPPSQDSFIQKGQMYNE